MLKEKMLADDKQVLQFARYFTILKPLLLKTSPTAFGFVCGVWEYEYEYSHVNGEIYAPIRKMELLYFFFRFCVI